MNIVLIGTIASGKTTIGKTIAELSEYQFIDTDKLLLDFTGFGNPEEMEELGELDFLRFMQSFHGAEERAIDQVSEMDGMVIATGAIVPSRPGAIERLRRNGVIIRLLPDEETAVIRAMESGRRFFINDEFTIEDAIKKDYRDSFYQYQDFDYSVDIDKNKTPEQCAREILAYVKKVV